MILECCGDLAYIYDIQGIIIGALLNIPMSDRLGLGWVSFKRIINLFFPPQDMLKFLFIHEMLVLGAFFEIAAYVVQYLAPPYLAFVLSFALAGIGNVFQVNIYFHGELQLEPILISISDSF